MPSTDGQALRLSCPGENKRRTWSNKQGVVSIVGKADVLSRGKNEGELAVGRNQDRGRVWDWSWSGSWSNRDSSGLPTTTRWGGER